MRRSRRSRIILHRGQAGAALRESRHLQHHGIRCLDEGEPPNGLNWKDSNYLVFTGNKVNLPERLDLWLSLPWLGSK